MSNDNRPPPLQLLPAFEASARLLSFSKAAQELHLTSSAISQQIKHLETLLGYPLFHRFTRRIELTEAGHQYAAIVSRTLASFRQDHAKFVRQFGKQEFRLSTTPLIAHEFVFPRIEAFQQRHPGVLFSIEASMDVVDFETTTIDASIRVGGGEWPGLTAWKICDCSAVFFAAPSLLDRQPVRDITDLDKHVLIRRRNEHFGWKDAAKLLGVSDLTGKGELLVDSDLAAANAAERGLGVALGFLPADLPLTSVWREDQLVAIFPPLKTHLKAYFVFRTSNADNELFIDAFAWILSLFKPH